MTNVTLGRGVQERTSSSGVSTSRGPHQKNTRDAVIDVAAIGVEFGGGPSFVAVREHLLPFLDEITAGQ